VIPLHAIVISVIDDFDSAMRRQPNFRECLLVRSFFTRKFRRTRLALYFTAFP
jgi:hypothetical protein